MTKTHTKRTWIVIRTEMCMTKTHQYIDSHSYRNVHDENAYKKNMDCHSYRNVHDENPYTKKWIVIRTKMCMTKTHTKTYADMDIQSTILYMTKHTTNLIQLVK